MSSRRDEIKRVIAKYENDIVSLEEREEDLRRRIQIFENLIPTVLVWYMWKISQADQPIQSDVQDDAQRKLIHLENILEELQDADQILKQEENIMRQRIEELETSLVDGSKQQYLDKTETLYKEVIPESTEIESKIVLKGQNIKLLEKKQEQFKDLLDGSETDWQKTCEELTNEISELRETLQKTNQKLKESEIYITQLEQDYAKKDAEVQEKISDLEKQTEALYSEVIDKEQERVAEEEQAAKEIEEAIEDFKSMKKSLTKSHPEVDTEALDKLLESDLKPDTIPTIIEESEEEEEEEVDIDLVTDEQLIRKSTDSKIKSLVTVPEDIIITDSGERLPRLSIETPLILEKIELETEKTEEPYDIEKHYESIKSNIDKYLSSKKDSDVASGQQSKEQSPEHSSLVLDSKISPVNSQKDSKTQSEEVLTFGPDEVLQSSVNKHDSSHSVPEITTLPNEQPTEVDAPAVDTPKTIEITESPTVEVEQTSELPKKLSNEMDIAPIVSGATEIGPSTEPEVSSTVSKTPSKASTLPINDLPTDLDVSPLIESEGRSTVPEIPHEKSASSARGSVTSSPEGIAAPVIDKTLSVEPTTDIPVDLKAADVTEAHAIISEPLDISSLDDFVKPTPSGLELQQEPGMLKRRPSIDSLAAKTLQSKCRVKDHLIKSMADQLRDLARKNVWSGNTLLENVSIDPVKTYDFDRTTLVQYLKGEEPKNFSSAFKSNESYSTSNPLNVRVLRKLDKDSILIEWGPPPSEEVVGFQIFINGEFMYWVHSANRNKALLHPLDLTAQLDLTVSPVNETGDIVYRSTVVYSPK